MPDPQAVLNPNDPTVLQLVDTVFKGLALFAGSVGAFFLGKWWDRRSRPQIEISEEWVNYSAPVAGQITGLNLTYKEQSYSSLAYYEVEVCNASKEAEVEEVPLLVDFQGSVAILETSKLGKPLPVPWTMTQIDPQRVEVKCGRLQPGDSASFGMLVTASVEPRVKYRGDRRIRLVDPNKRSSLAMTLAVVATMPGAVVLLTALWRQMSPTERIIQGIALCGTAIIVSRTEARKEVAEVWRSILDGLNRD